VKISMSIPPFDALLLINRRSAGDHETGHWPA